MADTLVLHDTDTLLLFDADTLYIAIDATGCDHLNEDGGLSLNEDGGVSILEGCPTATTSQQVGSGTIGRRGPYIDEGARLERLLRDDEELLLILA